MILMRLALLSFPLVFGLDGAIVALPFVDLSFFTLLLDLFHPVAEDPVPRSAVLANLA